ncbi:hypothetical protein QYE76_040489 [Lolium multiflorum]|uniref:CCHC-type domain-containing protein n=1 Tax=Lolium multiflorum TaxID=4521 RepID=A0AAD8TBU2_LOLMU|nr:hypothetical protein QYE76_040489 [Lolium multiflorum]
MLAMTGHAKKLSDLGIVIPNRLGINRILQSLPPSYKNFVMNYNMQNMNKELPELFAMLKSAEIEIKKEHQVLMVNKTTSFKKQGKSKGKNKKSGKKVATPPVKPKNGPKPDAECYYCKEKGHWKRNCSKYLADLKSGLVKKKKEVLFSAVFGFRNPSKEIFSESDEINAHILFFHEASRTPRGPAPGAPQREVAPGVRLRMLCHQRFRLRLFAYIKVPDLKHRKPRYEKPPPPSRPRSGDSSGAGTPGSARKAPPSTPPPSSSTLLSPMRRE